MFVSLWGCGSDFHPHPPSEKYRAGACFFIFGNSNKLLEKTPDKYMQLQSFPGVWTVVCLLYLQSRRCSQLPVGVLSLLSWESGSLQGPRALPQPGRAGEGLERPRVDALLRRGHGVRGFRAAPRVAEV